MSVYFVSDRLRIECRVAPAGPFPGFDATARPATAAEVAAHHAALAKLPPDDDTGRLKLRAAFYAEHITRWSIPDCQPTSERLLALPDGLFAQLDAVVTGYAPGTVVAS